MLRSIRNRLSDGSAILKGSSGRDAESKSEGGGEKELSKVYLPTLLLLSCLLLSTLYLLRHDNHQLAIADRVIRDLRRHVKEMREEMASGTITDGKKEMEAMKMKLGKSAVELNALKKNMKTCEDDLIQARNDLQAKSNDKRIVAKRQAMRGTASETPISGKDAARS